MNKFSSAVQTQVARTKNGMKAYQGTGQKCLDFFYKIGGMRGQDPTNVFAQALAENEDLAIRIMQWARDVRGGAGERKLFRDMLAYLDYYHPELMARVAQNVPEIGRFDDLMALQTPAGQKVAFHIFGDALNKENALVAKWLPRENKKTRPWINQFCKFFGVTPKFYRKTVSRLTKVVETQMCAKDWDNINFSHVPSVASSRYKKAFLRNCPDRYKGYIQALVSGTNPKVKINADAIFPHDVIMPYFTRGLTGEIAQVSLEEQQVIEAQWKALPNYVGDYPVLAMVDTSGSMFATNVSGTSYYVGNIALALGLYTADKNTGPFKDTFLTFSGSPKLFYLMGDIKTKIRSSYGAPWGSNTNIVEAFKEILRVAIEGNVQDKDMPKTLLILSDMQFDQCARFDDTAFESMKRSYEESGYTIPQVVFWNLADKGTVPIKGGKKGVALVSGYSPAIMKTVLSDTKSLTPEAIMLKAVMIDRYAV